MRTSRKDCLLILDKITSSQNPPSSIYTKRSSEFNRNVLNFRITRSSCSCRRRYYNLDTCRYLLNSLYLNYNALRTMFVQNKISKERNIEISKNSTRQPRKETSMPKQSDGKRARDNSFREKIPRGFSGQPEPFHPRPCTNTRRCR